MELRDAGEMYGFIGTERFAHSGMLKAALSIREFLQSSNILVDAYHSLAGSRNEALSTSSHTVNEPLNSDPNANLVIVGHSLG